MKCKNCDEKIECCESCGLPFSKDEEIICMFEGNHFCGLDCFFESFEDKGDGCKSVVMGDSE